MDNYFSKLIEKLNSRSAKAVVSQLSINSNPLRKHLLTLLEQLPGQPGSFLADPVFEAMFPWKQAENSMAQLSGNILHTDLIEAMDNPPGDLKKEYRFNKAWSPYLHQIEAWKELKKEPARSTIVTSGTGSGKTECFLVPILDDLIRNSETEGKLSGVRALFLYPLNALINSQRDRLKAWTSYFGENVRFCLYNGNTPDSVKAAIQRSQPQEVLSRKLLRDSPPPILVTNATMLEYMLVRSEDQPIIDASKGKLKWIVLDEAHTYLGSQAAEISLLLRRVLIAFGVKASEVHFIATSATIGSSDSKEQLRDFLANVAGVNRKQVSVIEGARRLPPLPELRNTTKISDLPSLQDSSPDVVFDELSQLIEIRTLREKLKKGPLSLPEIAQIFPELSNQKRDKPNKNILQLLDIAAFAKKEDQSLLPLRVHLFHRTQAGIWSCSNKKCEGRQKTDLDTTDWPWGKIFTMMKEQCDVCGSPVFELVRCIDCKNPFLIAEETFDSTLKPIKQDNEIDEFMLDAEFLDESEDADTESEQVDVDGTACLIAGSDYGSLQAVQVDAKTAQIIETSDNTLKLYQTRAESNILSCPCCGKNEQRRFSSFRPARLGAPFMLNNVVPTLLESAPIGKGEEYEGPYNGKRLITFTDSRQGTARFAAKMQQNAERNYVRSSLFHHVSSEADQSTDSNAIEEIQKQINAIKPLIESVPDLQRTHDDLVNKLHKLSQLKPGKLSWQNAKERLADDSRIWKFVKEYWADYSSDLNNSLEIARLFLYREFARRPKWQNNAETLGLLSLKYPMLDTLRESDLPTAFRFSNRSLQDWKDFLKVCLDFYVRDNSFINITHEFKRWIGAKVPIKYLLPPGKASIPEKHQKVWPQVNRAGRQPRLVLLLSIGLKLDFTSREHRDLINECLSTAWNQLFTIFEHGPDGSRLNLEKTEIEQITSPWLCPVTRKILDTTFCGITPYLPRNYEQTNLLCRSVDLPSLPFVFGNDSSGNPVDEDTIIDWLNSEPSIQKGRVEGYWSDINDKMTLQSPYFRVAEHSAQLPSNLLLKYESLFKSGQLNILSCSTTMELGVDIGGVSIVAMNNAPPNPANYLQRSGRAGRRQEQTAVSFTMCKNNPHGELVFSNPKWPFQTHINIPYVSLNSAPIVQRHVHALLLSLFLAQMVENNSINIIKLAAGSFFVPEDGQSNSLSDRFIVWLEKKQMNNDEIVDNKISRLVQGTSLAGQSLYSEATSAIQLMQDKWLDEYGALQADLERIKTSSNNKDNVAEKAINIQIDRLKREYLLSVLAKKGFTPGYGFPTNIASFVTLTKDDVNRISRQKKERKEREDNYFRHNGYPSRDLSIAIRDYAPGADIVLNGKVFRSSGVTLNWQLPPEAENVSEIQSIRYAWRCERCGVSGTFPSKPEFCTACQSDSLERIRYLEPAGFAVDLNYQPHNDIDNPLYLKVKEPWVTVDNRRWVSLPSRSIGQYRYSNHGSVFYQNRGEFELGYALCLRCGRMADLTKEDIEHLDVIPKQLNGHSRLRGGKNESGSYLCSGNEDSWAIIKEISLGHEQYTDVFELQLSNPITGRPISDQKAMFSLAVALREALANKLGVNADEMGCTVSKRKTEDGNPYVSAILFDKAGNGAGFSSSAGKYIVEILKNAREILLCNNHCETACQSCLLRFDTQFKVDSLDRHLALDVLNDTFMAGLKLDDNSRYFGDDSMPEFDQMDEAVMLGFAPVEMNELRIYLGGDPSSWDLFEWPLINKVRSWSLEGRSIKLVINDETLADLPLDIVKLLESMIRFNQIELVKITRSQQILEHNGFLIAEALSEHETVRWAVSNGDALNLSDEWGVSPVEDSGFQCVKVTLNEYQELNGTVVPADSLIPELDQNTIEIQWLNQLNGPIQEFGKKFLAEVFLGDSGLKELLASDIPLTRIVYSDRYLYSPLTARLLSEVAKSITGELSCAHQIKFEVKTTHISQYGQHPPSRVFHNWQNSNSRNSILNNLLSKLGFETSVSSYNKRDLPHSREFDLIFDDGTRKVIRLDQGFGFWRATAHEDTLFPFQNNEETQTKKLEEMEIDIESQSQDFPTIVYISEL